MISQNMDVVSCNAAITACGKAEEWPWAIHLLSRMGSIDGNSTPDVISYSAAASACTGEWTQALQVLHEAMSQGMMDRMTLSAVISACEKAAKWQHALHLFASTESLQVLPDVVMYSAVASACEKSSAWQHALLLLFEAEDQRLTNAFTYSAAVSACGKASEWQLGLVLLKTAEGRNLATVVTYSAAVTACEKASEWEQAVLMLGKAEGQKECNIITYNAGISAFEKAAKWTEALLLLDHLMMKQLQPTLSSFNAACSACEKSSAWEAAISILQQLDDRRLQADLITFNAAIGACGTANWQLALLLLRRTSAEIKPDVLSFKGALNAMGEGTEAMPVFLRLLSDMEAAALVGAKNAEPLPACSGQIMAYNVNIKQTLKLCIYTII